MEHLDHPFTELFEQLGLASDPESIKRFIERNGPIPEEIPLPDAPCWNEGQGASRREATEADADCAGVVDHPSASRRRAAGNRRTGQPSAAWPWAATRRRSHARTTAGTVSASSASPTPRLTASSPSTASSAP